nr:interleukin-27 subunit beta isoform X1 [Dasypus novemcinctus]
MGPRLLLAVALCAAGCAPCRGREAAPSPPRVRCRASRYPVAIDCSWTLPPAPNASRPTAFIATYRLGVAAQESRPCLQPAPEATRCAIQDVHLFSMRPYILNVTAVAPRGASSALVPFVAERISSTGNLCLFLLRHLAASALRVRGATPGRAAFFQVGRLSLWSTLLARGAPLRGGHPCVAGHYLCVSALRVGQLHTGQGDPGLEPWTLPSMWQAAALSVEPRPLPMNSISLYFNGNPFRTSRSPTLLPAPWDLLSGRSARTGVGSTLVTAGPLGRRRALAYLSVE